MQRPGRFLLAVSVVGMVLGGWSFGAAATDWESPVQLSGALIVSDATSPSVANDGIYLYVVWAAKVSPTDKYEVYIKRNAQQGAPANWEGNCIVSNNAGDSLRPDVAVWKDWIYVVWQDDTNRPAEYYDIHLARTPASGWGACPSWSTVTPFGGSGIDQYPRVAVSSQYAHVTWLADLPEGPRTYYARWDGVSAQVNPITQLSADPSFRSDITVSTPPTSDGIVNVVWECTPASSQYAEIYSIRSADSGATWPGAPKACTSPVSTGDDPSASSVQPSLGAFEDKVHLSWTEWRVVGLDVIRRIWYTRSVDTGSTWEMGRKISDDAANYQESGLTPCGLCVGVVYTRVTTAPPSKIYFNVMFSRSEDNGVTWKPAELLTGTDHERLAAIEADRRTDVGPIDGGPVDDFRGTYHVVYVKTTGPNVHYLRRYSEEKMLVINNYGPDKWGTSAALENPSSVEVRIFGGWIPQGMFWTSTCDVLTYQFTPHGGIYGGGAFCDVVDPSTGQTVGPLAETSAVTGPSTTPGIFVFGGRRYFSGSPGASDKILRYISPTNIGVMGTHLPTARYGTSAVSDGTQYAYIFGGRDASGAFLDTILCYSMNFDQISTHALRLNTPRAYTSAVWDDLRNAAYVFGGQTGALADTNEVLKFTPGSGCTGGSLQIVGSVPAFEGIYPGKVGTSAVLWAPPPGDPNPNRRFVYLFGGAWCAPECGMGYEDTVLRFDPNGPEALFYLECLALPTGRAYTSAVWHSGKRVTAVIGGLGIDWTLSSSLHQAIEYTGYHGDYA